MVNSKFKLAIVNLWNGKIHGIVPDDEIPNDVSGHPAMVASAPVEVVASTCLRVNFVVPMIVFL